MSYGSIELSFIFLKKAWYKENRLEDFIGEFKK